MRHIPLFAYITILTFTCTACGSGGPESTDVDPSGGSVSPSVAQDSTALTDDEAGLAISIFSGSSEANETAQASSLNEKTTTPVVDNAAANLIIAHIAARGRELIAQRAIADSELDKTVRIAETADAVTVVFENESIVTDRGQLILNGPVVFTLVSDTAFTVAADIAVQFANFHVHPKVRERTLEEVINGTVTLGVAVLYNAVFNDSGTQITRIDVDGGVSFAGSQIELAGTVSGTITGMSLSAEVIGSFHSSGSERSWPRNLEHLKLPTQPSKEGSRRKYETISI